MKWLIFTGACVAALISLGVLAVDEPDVIWEGRNALCPYCRSDIKHYALACKECRKTIDWEAQTETCRWCLSDDDVRILRDGMDALELGPDEALPASVAEFTKAYLVSIEAGDCTYCGGLGKVVDGAADAACPICRGGKRCVACQGERTTVYGSQTAHDLSLQRQEVWAAALRREELTHLELRRDQLVNDDVEALQGYAEAEQLKTENGDNLLQTARQRIARAFKAIRDAVNAREPASGG